MSTYYPPVQGPSGATGGLGRTQTNYQDPRRRRLAQPAGPAQVPPPYATGPQQQFQDIMREAALQRRMQGPAQAPGQYTSDNLPGVEPGINTLLPEEQAPAQTGGPFADVLADPQQFEQMLSEAAMRGRITGRQQVQQRRSVADTVNDVSQAIQRRLAELTQGVLR